MLIREQGLDSPERLRVLTDKNINDICNVMRKPGTTNANRMPYIRQQVLVIVHENLKLAAFLFHHRWTCTLDWEGMGVHEDIVHLLAGQKRLEDDYKDPDVLPRINKSDMAGTKEAIEKYPRSCHGVLRAPLAYVIRKYVLVGTYGDDHYYATSDKERCYTYLQTRTNSFWKIMFTQLKSIQQSMR